MAGPSMATPVRSSLRVVLPDEEDYASSFTALASVELKLRNSPKDAALLTRKAMLEFNCGNYVAGLAAAREAYKQADDPANEARFQLARAYILLAIAKARGVTTCDPRVASELSVNSLLSVATEHLNDLVALCPEDDEGRVLRDDIARLVWDEPDERSCLARLQAYLGE